MGVGGVSMRGLGYLGVGLAALVAGAGAAQAGGFAVREQSASSQGASFAGAAAGGDLSTMFWNSAGVTTSDGGFDSEGHYALILPGGNITAKAGTEPALLAGPFAEESGSIGRAALVPASYYSYQLGGIDPNLYVGLAINAPFGLTTEPEDSTWVGAQLARTTSLFTMNANPMVGYRLAPGFSIGAGAQVQYMEGRLTFATGTPLGPSSEFDGEDIGVGFTLGALLEPTQSTKIGIGYRSQVSSTLEGKLLLAGITPGYIDASVDVNTPDILTLSLRQSLTPSLRLLGTIEWTDWSDFQELQVVSAAPIPVSIPAGWEDGWFYSLGLESVVSEQLTLRAGLAYEQSPITEPEQRLVGVPDANRTWVSLGATYAWSPSWRFDIGYSHVFFEDTELNRSGVGGAPTLVADVEEQLDIVSFGYKYKWGE